MADTQGQGTAPAEQTSESEQRPRLGNVRRTVLVVEDDPANRELVVELLTSWGYEVLAVGSAEEAEWVAKRKDLSAAVVDVFLPGRNGAVLMSKLRERFPEALLVGMSALGDAAMARRCKGQGADFFIGKPVISEELAEVLKERHATWH